MRPSRRLEEIAFLNRVLKTLLTDERSVKCRTTARTPDRPRMVSSDKKRLPFRNSTYRIPPIPLTMAVRTVRAQ